LIHRNGTTNALIVLTHPLNHFIIHRVRAVSVEFTSVKSVDTITDNIWGLICYAIW
jgi:hypothetical protein